MTYCITWDLLVKKLRPVGEYGGRRSPTYSSFLSWGTLAWGCPALCGIWQILRLKLRQVAGVLGPAAIGSACALGWLGFCPCQALAALYRFMGLALNTSLHRAWGRHVALILWLGEFVGCCSRWGFFFQLGVHLYTHTFKCTTR